MKKIPPYTKKIITKALMHGMICIREKEIKLSAGKTAPIYHDAISWTVDSLFRKIIIKAFTQLEPTLKKNKSFLVGVASSALPLTALLAHKFGLACAFGRPERKLYGLRRQIEGYPALSPFSLMKECIVIEDHVSTGKNALQVVRGLEDVGVKVKKILSISTCNWEATKKKFKEKNIEHKFLFSWEDVLELNKTDHFWVKSIHDKIQNWWEMENTI